IVHPFMSYSQSVSSVVLAPLPEVLTESSGLESNADYSFWSHNDSGNAPKLIRIDTLGQVLQQLEIDAINVDWEDMTKDVDGNLYIGDFGNNDNVRTD